MTLPRRTTLRGLPLLLTITFALSALALANGNKGYQFQPVDEPDAGPLGTSVFGISSAGVMVGNFGDTEGVVRGFVVRGGQWTSVTVDDSPATTLTCVYRQGTAAGDFADDLFIYHGFLYAADGTITYLPDPVPGPSNLLGGINNQGAVTGYYTEDGFATAHGYIYEKDSFTFFDFPGSSYTVPNRITDSGTVCGYFIDGQGNAHGFVRDKKGTFTQIDVPGALGTVVYGMNDHGDIVGLFGDQTTLTLHGFLLRKGAYLTLDYPGATDTEPLDINNAGNIVGTYNSFSRGFLATP
jgi:hypothetical protein